MLTLMEFGQKQKPAALWSNKWKTHSVCIIPWATLPHYILIKVSFKRRALLTCVIFLHNQTSRDLSPFLSGNYHRDQMLFLLGSSRGRERKRVKEKKDVFNPAHDWEGWKKLKTSKPRFRYWETVIHPWPAIAPFFSFLFLNAMIV